MLLPKVGIHINLTARCYLSLECQWHSVRVSLRQGPRPFKVAAWHTRTSITNPTDFKFKLEAPDGHSVSVARISVEVAKLPTGTRARAADLVATGYVRRRASCPVADSDSEQVASGRES